MAKRRGFRAPKDYDPRRVERAKQQRSGGARGESATRSGTGARGEGNDHAREHDVARGSQSGSSRAKQSAGQSAEQQKNPGAEWAGKQTQTQPNLPELHTLPASLVAKITRPADVAGLTFADLGLGGNIVRALAELGAERPFPIQAATIPDVLAGHHLLGRARTGSGKTIAFGAALVERLLKMKAEGAFPNEKPKAKLKRGERSERQGKHQVRAPKALILAPTRELALQLDRTVQPIARAVGLYTGQFVGGQPFEPQLHALGRGVDIAIGTPGRIEDLALRGHLSLGQIAVTVIDEADHMAELGFIDQVQRILRQTRRGGQRMLFSATLDRGVDGIVREFMPKPAIHEIAGDGDGEGGGAAGSETPGDWKPQLNVPHSVCIVMHEHKEDAIVQLVRSGGAGVGSAAGGSRGGAGGAVAGDSATTAARSKQGSGKGRRSLPVRTVVFCRTRAYAETITELLSDSGVRAISLHGDLSQSRRELNLAKFVEGRADVLVATDVAARGLHVDDIELVLQADPPGDPKVYIHRAGRTGRVGRAGRVITLIPRNRQKRTKELFETLGFEPQFFGDFVPAGSSR